MIQSLTISSSTPRMMFFNCGSENLEFKLGTDLVFIRLIYALPNEQFGLVCVLVCVCVRACVYAVSDRRYLDHFVSGQPYSMVH